VLSSLGWWSTVIPTAPISSWRRWAFLIEPPRYGFQYDSPPGTGHSRGVNQCFERPADDGTIPGLFNTWRQGRRPVFATARREGHAASGLCPTKTSGSEGLLRFSAKSVCAQGQTGVSPVQSNNRGVV
jgi:hypothetical protein